MVPSRARSAVSLEARSNEEVAAALARIADLLEAQEANPFRVRAYRNAAETIRRADRPVAAILEESGLDGLTRLPGIGESLARSIEQLVHTGRLSLLDRLRGAASPEDVFLTVPGVGRELARRIHEELGIESLADLEIACYDGRLAQVPGIGRRRLTGIRESLAGRFRRGPMMPVPARTATQDEPPVAEILDVDREYRVKSAKKKLPLIAPRRFNPKREAWLPVLHTTRDGRHYTALHSNTARAHELGMTGDWVVIYRDDHDGHGQWTVVTSRLGPLSSGGGRRIVRGRERECVEHYADSPPANGQLFEA
jgi:hypothetical protein